MGNLQTLKLEYEEYLRNQRGLSERSIYHCWRFADRFLAFRFKGKDSARGISDLDQAELNLRYCQIAAEIDGVIARRNVNPGNNVLAGQDLMAIRSLGEIWVDANFKETQLRDLRIGQPVDLQRRISA